MKKSSIIAASLLSLGCLCADDNATIRQVDGQSKFSGNVGMKFATEYNVKGRQETPNRVFMPSAELSYQMFDSASVYIGTDAVLKMKEDGVNDVAPYIGCMYNISDMFAVDLGYTHHFWEGASQGSTISYDSKEPYFGVLIDVTFRPSLYFEYDCNHKQLNVVGTTGHSFDLSQYTLSGVSVDLEAKLGYVHCKRLAGVDIPSEYGKRGYVYYGVSADLVYSITDCAKVRAGIACEGNGTSKKSWANIESNAKNMIWFNASANYAF